MGAFEPSLLAQKGSLFFTRPTLMTYCAAPKEMLDSAAALFFAVHAGLRVEIGLRLPLTDAATAPSRFGISPNHRRYGAFTLIFAAPYLQNYR